MMSMYDDDDYGGDPYYDQYGQRIATIADYNIDEQGCRTDRYTHFAISVYDMYEEGVDSIVKFIWTHLNDYCKEGIDPNYFAPSRVMNDNDYLIILSYTPDREREEDETIVGFAVVSDVRGRTNGDDNSMYVDVICSNNELHQTRFQGGKAILHVIIEYARANGYDSVSLKALSNVVTYYRQFGFRFLKNGEANELDHIHRLAELNKTQRISSPAEANRMLLIERAIMFSREVDEDGQPGINRELLRENLRDELSLDHTPTDAEAEDLIKRVSESVRDDGSNGLHDLFFSLIKSGYADIEGCPGITKRQFVRPEEVSPGVWRKWMTCEGGGFQMRKLLRSGVSSDPDVHSPIAQCSFVGGKHKRKQTKRRNHPSRRQTRRH